MRVKVFSVSRGSGVIYYSYYYVYIARLPPNNNKCTLIYDILLLVGVCIFMSVGEKGRGGVGWSGVWGTVFGGVGVVRDVLLLCAIYILLCWGGKRKLNACEGFLCE